MVDEVVQVHVLAPESVQSIAMDGFSNAIDTLGIVETRPLGAVEGAASKFGFPLFLISVSKSRWLLAVKNAGVYIRTCEP